MPLLGEHAKDEEDVYMLSKAFIPYKGYFSTPFCRWQGAMANENSIVLGAKTAARWIAERGWEPGIFDYLVFGNTIGQLHQFYSAPFAAALMGCGGIPGIAVSQACTTGTTCIFQAATFVETGMVENAFVLTTDRSSNGPHTIDVDIDPAEMAHRRKNWTAPPYKVSRGILFKYIKTVRSASEGCVTDA